MSFDFTTYLDRTGIDTFATDLPAMEGLRLREGFDTIPMRIADMNFPIAPAVIDAIEKRLTHPILGYFPVSPAYYEAVRRWHRTRNGVTHVDEALISYDNSVIGGVVTAATVLTPPKGAILLHAPTYPGFTGPLTEAGFRPVSTFLVPDEAGVYRMDYEDMEKKIVENGIRTAVLCSPHNPTGRVWERWELEKAMEIYQHHGVTVLSDEIWSDLMLDGHRHIPTQTVSDYAKTHTVAFYSTSKSFNLAGLVGSYHLTYNAAMHAAILREADRTHYNGMNVLTMHAVMGAYSEAGEAWLNELLGVLSHNAATAHAFVTEELPGVTSPKPQGTYLLYLDCTDWCQSRGKTVDDILRAAGEVGVLMQDGRPFHGPYHLRMTLALPTHKMEEGLRRLKEYVFI